MCGSGIYIIAIPSVSRRLLDAMEDLEELELGSTKEIKGCGKCIVIKQCNLIAHYLPE